MYNLGIVTFILLLFSALSIEFVFYKSNIFIPKNEFYQSKVLIKKENTSPNPMEISIRRKIRNTIVSSSDEIDYFSALNNEDFECYTNSYISQSYLYPCMFLENKNSFIKNSVIETFEEFKTNQDNAEMLISYKNVIDNTKFPFPKGSLPYKNLNMSEFTHITIKYMGFSLSKFQFLLQINILVFALFFSIALVLFIKNKKITQKMELKKSSSFQSESEIEPVKSESSLEIIMQEEKRDISESLLTSTAFLRPYK